MSNIFLSPHLDDVILSCGGFIYKLVHEKHEKVEIWTFASGIPEVTPKTRIVSELLNDWKFSSAKEAVESRIDEDFNAASVLGVKSVFLNFLDCIYRRNNKNEYPYDNVFVEPEMFDYEMMDQYRNELMKNLTDTDIVYAPFSIGGHVDHRIVHTVSKQLNRKIKYFLDVPYSIWHPDEIDMVTKEYNEYTESLSDSDFIKWEEAIKEYKSQIETLFDDVSNIQSELKKFCKSGFRVFEK